MKSTLLKLFAFAAGLLFTISSVHAQTLVSFSFDEVDAYAPTFVDSGIISNPTEFSAFGIATRARASNPITNIGPGTDAAGTDYALGEAETSYFQTNGYTSTYPNTIATDYVGFNFDVTQATNLGSLIFDMGQGGTSGPRGFDVLYNINDGAEVAVGTAALDLGAASQYGRYSFDLGSIGLSASDNVEFRFYGFSTAGGNSIRLDNVSVAAIPEPSILALVGIALASLMILRRR